MSKVDITMTGPHTGRVYVDGVEVQHVVALSFSVDVRPGSEMPAYVEITQRIWASDLSLTGDIDITTLSNSDRGRRYRRGMGP